MYKKILYPIKFEEFSLNILSCVVNFKKIGTTEIILLHVIDVSKLPMDKYEGYSEADVKRWTEIAKIKMIDAENIIKNAGLKAKSRIEVGVPYREILRVAKEEDVSLIVSGRQKRSILGEIFIGSNTDKIIRYGNIPVYIPKYPAMFDVDKEACERFCERLFKKVLYPTDWSDCARETLQHLKELKGTGIDEIVVAHVMNEDAMRLQSPEKFREFERIDKEKLEAVKKELGKEGLIAKTRLDVGNPRSNLIRIAREEDVSLIVIGSHGKGYVQGILWGSVSRNVVEYSDRPVLLIKCE
ncbi:universal stress protein [Dissulfurispira thermophila]|uniref:Universal stress protein n=2 Tax=root TaxID=1 RepID=A0A7G1H2L5_9BACT|nr:universal stress protein [Dissulfurispira thermophila]BCB97054.1 universal stress protein [Dissulfurispira thermophila]